MGGLYIVPEREISGFDPYVNGRNLAQASDELDALAKRLTVRPLMGFFSAHPDEVAALFDEESGGPGLEGLALPPEVWFEADDGLKTVEKLLAYIADNPNAVSDSKRVVEDLREFQSVLQRLSAKDVKWHLSVDN
ncbi:MAG TPA: hypothetical protein VGP63_23460 [Planctomycetaceae bacterium]|jgi:hypothetical protein|nr:hypothetical protein [Planctomycetaceae bacterium]